MLSGERLPWCLVFPKTASTTMTEKFLERKQALHGSHHRAPTTFLVCGEVFVACSSLGKCLWCAVEREPKRYANIWSPWENTGGNFFPFYSIFTSVGKLLCRGSEQARENMKTTWSILFRKHHGEQTSRDIKPSAALVTLCINIAWRHVPLKVLCLQCLHLKSFT